MITLLDNTITERTVVLIVVLRVYLTTTTIANQNFKHQKEKITIQNSFKISTNRIDSFMWKCQFWASDLSISWYSLGLKSVLPGLKPLALVKIALSALYLAINYWELLVIWNGFALVQQSLIQMN